MQPSSRRFFALLLYNVGTLEPEEKFRLWRLFLTLSVAVFAAAGMLPERALAVTVLSGTLNASSPTMTDQILRDGISSNCSAIKSFPGVQTPVGTIQYQLMTYTNVAQQQCVTFTYSGGSCGPSA